MTEALVGATTAMSGTQELLPLVVLNVSKISDSDGDFASHRHPGQTGGDAAGGAGRITGAPV